MKIGVVTLGCPKNTADTEAILMHLPPRAVLANIPDSDMVLLNTCAFLKTARDEVYEHLERLKDRKVILMGCMSGLFKEEVFKTHPQVYAVVSGSHYRQIASIVHSVFKGDRVYAVGPEPKEYLEMPGKFMITPRSFAYVKIAEGCNNGCAFCVIPELKGKFRSRKAESILDEIKMLVKNGVREIMLVSQDSGCYGFDFYGKIALSELLKQIDALPGDFWVRVMYLYPERVTDELLQTIAQSSKICHYLDMPLQHGDPGVLKRMLRPFSADRTVGKIKRIREIMPDVTLRTTFIVGFPGETAKAFLNLLNFIEEMQFDNVGVFTYSHEPNTTAYQLRPLIPEWIRQSRRRRLMLAQQKIALKKHQSMIGRVYKTLIEKYDPESRTYLGRSEHFAPHIDGEVIVKSAKELTLNRFYPVEIVDAEPYDLIGIIHP